MQFASLVWLYFGVIFGAFAADVAGVVTDVNGALSAKGLDGTLRALVLKSGVSSGDTLITGKNSHARIKFADGAEIALNQATQFKVEDYHFNEAQPNKDTAGFNLLKGSLRAISGLIGKRGDPDSYRVKTLAATAGIRGTDFGLLFCQSDCSKIQDSSGKPVENGLHLDVAHGAIVVKNDVGSQRFDAGQYGYVRDSRTPPVTRDYGVRVDIPPPRIIEDRAGSKKDDRGSDSQGPAARGTVVKKAQAAPVKEAAPQKGPEKTSADQAPVVTDVKVTDPKPTECPIN